MSARYINILFNIVIATLWLPGIALASSLDKTILSVSGVVVALVFFLSTMGGVSALLYRLKTELIKNDGKLPYVWVFVGANMVGGWLAGFLSFAMCEAVPGMNDWLQMVTIAVGAFGGGRTIERFAEKFFPGIGNEAAVDR